ANCRIVAFVAKYDNGDVTENELINAAQESNFTLYDKSNESDPNHPDNPNNPNSANNPLNWPTAVTAAATFQSNVTVRPNPISDLGIIEFDLATTEQVSIAIYDINGRMVKDIYTQTRSSGSHKAAFTTSDLGEGVYFVRVQSPSFVAQKSV